VGGSRVTTGQPEQFGKYQLLEKIATGGMAEVYRARAFGTAGFEKILVIKKVLDHMTEDTEFIEMFIDEARIAVQLAHVNIVQVFDLGEVDGQYFMAMEYVHGLDLSRLLTRARNLGSYPIPLALFVISEALKGLQFAHERVDEDGKPLNIVHCDVSPQNILISYAGEVKIHDFGIARAAFQADTKHRVVRGKYAYMSPE
jgi:serine/threonine protein kinase